MGHAQTHIRYDEPTDRNNNTNMQACSSAEVVVHYYPKYGGLAKLETIGDMDSGR